MAARLRLLAEQLKISIQERNRLLSLNVVPSLEDEDEIQHSMKTLSQGISSLDGNGTEYKSDAVQDEIMFLKVEYRELRKLNGNMPSEDEFAPAVVNKRQHSVPYRDEPVDAREALLPERLRKSVRFTDSLIESDSSNGELLQMQSQIMREQDNSLDALSESIGRQRELSMQIGDELDEHGELLDDVTTRVDRTQDRLNSARDRLTVVSRKAREHSHLLTIVILIIVLVFLLALL